MRWGARRLLWRARGKIAWFLIGPVVDKELIRCREHYERLRLLHTRASAETEVYYLHNIYAITRLRRLIRNGGFTV